MLLRGSWDPSNHLAFAARMPERVGFAGRTPEETTSMKTRAKWGIGVIAAVIVIPILAITAGVWVYINWIKDDPPPAFSLDESSSVTTEAAPDSTAPDTTAVAGTSGTTNAPATTATATDSTAA